MFLLFTLSWQCHAAHFVNMYRRLSSMTQNGLLHQPCLAGGVTVSVCNLYRLGMSWQHAYMRLIHNTTDLLDNAAACL